MKTNTGEDVSKLMSNSGLEITTVYNSEGKIIYSNYVEPIVTLRNIQVGDNLSGKMLYFNFPRNLYAQLADNETINIITTEDPFFKVYSSYSGEFERGILVGDVKRYWVIIESDKTTITNSNGMILIDEYENFGIVTGINPSHPAYEYIKILDEEQAE